MRAGGIRSQPATVPLQQCVDVAEDHSGAYPHAAAVILHFAAIPVTAHVDQDVVGLRLTVEAGARRPKRRMPPGLTAIAEELNDVIGRSRQHDNLRDEPIRAGIGGIPNEIDCSVKDFLFSQEGDEIGLKAAGCPVDQRVGDCIVHRRCVEPSDARRVRGKQLSNHSSALAPGMARLARKFSISAALNPSCSRTCSLCSPSAGARLAGTLVTPCT